MPEFYNILDWFFTVLHTVLILFNLTGWIWRYVRRLNLISLLLTAGSWVFLGFIYGFGYCPLTDWHFDILYRLGETGLPDSYTQYLIQRVLSIRISAQVSDIITMAGLITALIFSIFFNVKDYRTKKLLSRN